jgi:hypothetical protein
MKTKKLISHILPAAQTMPTSDANEVRLKTGAKAIHDLLLASFKKHHWSKVANPSANTLVLAKTINTHKLIR